MKKGQISNQLAFGVGVDCRILVDAVPPKSALDKFLGRDEFAANRAGDEMVDRLWKRGLRVYAYVVEEPDWATRRILKVLADMNVTKVIVVPSRVDLGNHHLKDVDVYFTDDFDFYDVFRLIGNVRYYDQPSDVYNYVRYKE